MKKADVTKKLLFGAVEDLNKVMGLDPPIKTLGRKVTNTTLTNDLKDSAKELEESDVLKEGTIEVLSALEIELPEKQETTSVTSTPAPAPDEPKKKSSGRFAMEHFCDEFLSNPDVSPEDCQKALKNAGLKTLSENTMYYWHKDTIAILEYLQSKDMLK
jgi:hypothetical protein